MTNTITISSIEEYIHHIKGYYYMEGCPGIIKFFYRGQSNEKDRILPTLGRCFNDDFGEDATFRPYENIIIQRAKLEYPLLFTDSNEIDELALMQHYGLPTRLLDITDNPLVALYFACINMNSNGEVFLFSESADMRFYTSYDAEIIKESNELAIVRTKIRSDRQRIQQGYFMWFPDKRLHGIDKNDSIIRDIVSIPQENKAALIHELRMVGISTERLFPDDIDKCCKEILTDITKNAFSA